MSEDNTRVQSRTEYAERWAKVYRWWAVTIAVAALAVLGLVVYSMVIP